MRTSLDAFIAADAVYGTLGDGVFVDAQDIHLAQNTLRTSFNALPTGLAYMGVDENMIRLMFG